MLLETKCRRKGRLRNVVHKLQLASNNKDIVANFRLLPDYSVKGSHNILTKNTYILKYITAKVE